MSERARKMSDAKIRANRKYNEKAYDRINITVKKGRREEIKAAAEGIGESANAFIVKAVEERMERLKGM